VKEAGSDVAGGRTGIGNEAASGRASAPKIAKLSWPRPRRRGSGGRATKIGDLTRRDLPSRPKRATAAYRLRGKSAEFEVAAGRRRWTERRDVRDDLVSRRGRTTEMGFKRRNRLIGLAGPPGEDARSLKPGVSRIFCRTRCSSRTPRWSRTLTSRASLASPPVRADRLASDLPRGEGSARGDRSPAHARATCRPNQPTPPPRAPAKARPSKSAPAMLARMGINPRREFVLAEPSSAWTRGALELHLFLLTWPRAPSWPSHEARGHPTR